MSERDDKKDAERYRWLRERMYAADFAYGADDDGVGGEPALIFKMPHGMRFTTDCDKVVDEAMMYHPRY